MKRKRTRHSAEFLASMQSKGGLARAESLTPEERTEIAKKAAGARWSLPRVICGAPDFRPLKIGNIEIPCYVLEGEKRVLVQRAIVSGMGTWRVAVAARGAVTD